MARTRRAAYRHGHLAELAAAALLLLKGYRLIARRYKTPLGEIDLVVKRGRLIAFVEVKARGSFRDALEAVGPAAERRIVGAADLWLAKHPDAVGSICATTSSLWRPGAFPSTCRTPSARAGAMRGERLRVAIASAATSR